MIRKMSRCVIGRIGKLPGLMHTQAGSRGSACRQAPLHSRIGDGHPEPGGKPVNFNYKAAAGAAPAVQPIEIGKTVAYFHLKIEISLYRIGHMLARKIEVTGLAMLPPALEKNHRPIPLAVADLHFRAEG